MTFYWIVLLSLVQSVKAKSSSSLSHTKRDWIIGGAVTSAGIIVIILVYLLILYCARSRRAVITEVGIGDDTDHSAFPIALKPHSNHNDVSTTDKSRALFISSPLVDPAAMTTATAAQGRGQEHDIFQHRKISMRLPSSPAPAFPATYEETPANNACVSIAVMGATGTGKTTFTNLITGSHLRVSDGLESCTTEVQVSFPFELGGQLVELIDTPGFDDVTRSDADVLNMIATYLCDTYWEGKKLAGIIFMHRISDFRVGGVATKNFRMFKQLCGDHALKNLTVVTNMWGEVSLEKGEIREQELKTNSKFFKNVIDKGASIVRHDNTVDCALEILRGIVNKQPIVLTIQDEMINQRKNLTETQAAKELHWDVMEEVNRRRAQMANYKREAEANAQWMKQYNRAAMERERWGEINQMERERELRLAEYCSEKQRMEQTMQQMETAHDKKIWSIKARMPYGY